MALRNQPYIPLYVQDFMTDEKLNECSAAANGIYIRLMCLMHKSENYGTILLKQKYKKESFDEVLPNDLPQQNLQQISFFAEQLSKQMPFSVKEIFSGLEELLREKVVQIEGDVLSQKRMVNDGILSDKRSSAGSKGAKKTNAKYKKENFVEDFVAANSSANHEYEYENEIEAENEKINSYIVPNEKFFKVDPYDGKSEKYFKIYEQECPQLVKLGFERRDNKTFVALAEFRAVIQDDLEYFRKVCKKANKLIVICSNKIDFRSILSNHIGIYGEKYGTGPEERRENGFEY